MDGRWPTILALWASVLGWAGCRPDRGLQEGRSVAPALSNIVLITIDTIRADRLGCYGYFRDTTPEIDRFAKECILFERCLAPMATTLPAHTSILTGTYPIEHGVLANVAHGGLPFQRSPRLRSLAEVASQAGYLTAAFVSAAPLKRGTGMESGFQEFDQPILRERSARDTNERVFTWLEARSTEPYLLWVHYYDPHTPYEPPPPYDTMFQTDQRQQAYLAERRFVSHPAGKRGFPRSAAKINNRYDGEIRYVDSQVGRLLERLRSLETWDRTVVVLVGDHGQSVWQHGEGYHGSIHDEQLHVPLLIRKPGIAGRRFAAVVSAVDLPATLIGLIEGFPADEFLEQTSGRNVLAEGFEPTPVFSHQSHRKRDDRPFPTYALTSGQWKYVHQIGGTDRLYHLSRDPHELHDVLPDHLQLAAELRAQVLSMIAQQSAKAAAYQGGRADPPEPLDPAVLEQLRSLGYVE